MKKLRRAIRLLTTLLIAGFVGLGGWLAYTVYTQGPRWSTNPYNSRLNTAKKTIGMGTITDRNGTVLAYTDETGLRHYNEDSQIRRAVSQTVGDQMNMSGTGVESFHAGTLLGLSGSIIDRTFQYVTGQAYQGDNIRLTIDADLSAYIAKIFPSGKSGAVVLLNYRTGEILALVSEPSYDPAALATRQTTDDETGSGYLNRCLQGQYAPGSIFKIVTLYAALTRDPNALSRTFTCEGSRAFGSGKVTCYGGEVHGSLTLEDALIKSCNVTFAQLATELGPEALLAAAKDMGFNDNFQFRDLVLYESTMPEGIDQLSELAWTGVGQGRLLVTPLHMAMLVGAIANDGVLRTPQLIREVTGAGGLPRLRTPAGVYKRVASTDVAKTIAGMLRKTVARGTATKAKLDGYTVCGKTGTAETSDDKSVPNNAWFIGYIQEAEAPYAVAVIVEQGGTGGSTAAPIAAKALRAAAKRG